MNTLVAVLLGAAVLVWPVGAATAAGRSVLASGPPARRRTGTLPSVGWMLGHRLSARSAEGHAQRVLDLLDALGPALRSGLPPAAALAVVNSAATATTAPPPAEAVQHDDPPTAAAVRGGPREWAQELTRVEYAARRGASLGPAWSDVAERTGSRELMILARSWTVSERLGAPLAQAVSTAADILRARLEQERRLAAATAGARATMNLLTGLPLAGIMVAALMGIDPLGLYGGSALSMGSLVLGLALLTTGRRIVSRMIRQAVRGSGS